MKKLLSMVLCAMMALTLAGCGGSSDDSSTYTYSSELDIKNLDSSDADDGCSFTAMHAVIDGLMKTDKKGNVVNGVASSSEVSDDGLTHTYKIRKDANFPTDFISKYIKGIVIKFSKRKETTITCSVMVLQVL